MLISLKAARVNAGLTQEEAANALGINKSTLISYEAYRTLPNIELARRMSELYALPSENIKFF